MTARIVSAHHHHHHHHPRHHHHQKRTRPSINNCMITIRTIRNPAFNCVVAAHVKLRVSTLPFKIVQSRKLRAVHTCDGNSHTLTHPKHRHARFLRRQPLETRENQRGEMQPHASLWEQPFVSQTIPSICLLVLAVRQLHGG